MRILFCIIFIAFASSAPATTIGLGMASADQPALSVHISKNFVDAVHVTTHYGPQQAGLTADYQRFFVPDFGFGYAFKWGFYTGGGLGGDVQADSAHEESYYLRLPLGTQVDFHALHMQIFAEGAANLGALPRTAFSGSLMAGLRAKF